MHYKKILIIRFGAMGDVILTTPLLKYAKQKFPDAEIDFLTKEDYKLLLEHHPLLKNVYTINSGTIDDLFSVIKILKKNNYNLIIDLHSNLRSFIIKKSLFTSHTITYKKNIIERRLLVNYKINLMKNKIHIVERYLKTLDKKNELKKIPLPFPDIYSSLEIKNKINTWISSLGLEQDEILVGFNPSAIHPTKCWPIKKFIELGNLLSKQFKVRILIFGGKKDMVITREIADRLNGRAISAAGIFNILETFEIIKHLHILVTGDTGLMHLASASRTPLVAIFGPTVQEFGFWPYGDKDIIIEKKLSCRPCSLHGTSVCPIDTHICMEDIQAEEVLAECLKIISKIKEGRHGDLPLHSPCD